ncbi:hypothetical protein [Mahella australiensis]|uniref:Extracellular solute-binding protein family 1 n=1 Tax=Mahella australiensis (strain DSM 15567 / CIP 107919 / 50-1 BON) TaxID=697281 RepID=F3ZZ45_MAHA5|nr:hypothetical protein [Mahella australiensis]AEE97827.1 hypothetical protein Mahau_2691 [Mahella australiensis 50-1 BON]
MSKVLTKWLAMMMVLLLALSVLAGCGQKEEEPQPSEQGDGEEQQQTEEAKNYWDMLDQVSDSSDLPDWTGKKLELSMWQAHGPGEAELKKSDGDVVTPEIFRVTGVKVDADESFDNGGQTADVKLGMLAASGDWPDLILNASMSGGLTQLVENDKLYDLTDLIPKYMPNLMKKLGQDVLKQIADGDTRVAVNGKIYGIPGGITEQTYPMVEKSIDAQKYAIFSPPQDWGYIWVRDDVLKKLYPDAKSQKDIEELYMQKGSFTKEDILDVSINSKDDFVKFLYDVKKVIDQEGLKEGNQPVQVTYGFAGVDNWGLFTNLTSWLEGASSGNNYFTYYDKKTQKIEYMFKQPWFKEDLAMWNKLVRDGIVSKESLIDNNAAAKDKINKGLYAVCYYNTIPDPAVFKSQNKPYNYRKVYLNIPVKYDQFVVPAPLPKSTSNVAIFKDSVKEEDLPQILHWLDFMISDTGEKLESWGPKSAGLWEENNGKRVFKDKDLEAEMVYGEPGDKWAYYNLGNSWVTGETEKISLGWKMPFVHWHKTKFNPAYMYDRQRNPNEANTYFSLGFVEPIKTTQTKPFNIYNFSDFIPEVQKAWAARQSFEDAMLKTLAASSDSEFEKLYNDFISTVEKNGYNDDVLAKINELFPKYNEAYMQNLK